LISQPWLSRDVYFAVRNELTRRGDKWLRAACKATKLAWQNRIHSKRS